MATALLIVDDSDTELALMSKLAQKAFPNVRVHTATSALTAQEACAQTDYDCVVLDYNMPDTNGLACARGLRDSLPFLPIVMSTSFGDEMLAVNAMTSGVTDYIPKSRMTAPALHRVVSNAIRITQQARTIDEQRRELESFAYSLAHDFKQPIRQIKTFAKLLTEAIHDGSDEGIERHLSFLNDAARRLGDLVDVMSQYTLLGQPPTIEDVDLNRVLTNVQASLAPYIEERCGTVRYVQAPTVRGNEALFSQVFQNLIVNGLKYNKSDSPTVDIWSEQSSGRCIIKVHDNGIGIEPQYYDEIFKPLTRLHSNSEYSGTGLGLTLAKTALGKMGGAITCSSTVGVGTEFIVEIALASDALCEDQAVYIDA
jgi:signal transduction histidine kinase